MLGISDVSMLWLTKENISLLGVGRYLNSSAAVSNKVCFETERPKEAAVGQQAAAAGVANCAEKEELDSHTRTHYNSEER